MSYARFFSTDVYVFRHVEGFLCCQACRMTPDPENRWFGDFETKKRSEMIAHLDEHEKRGQRTGTARERLRKEIESVGNIVGASWKKAGES